MPCSGGCFELHLLLKHVEVIGFVSSSLPILVSLLVDSGDVALPGEVHKSLYGGFSLLLELVLDTGFRLSISDALIFAPLRRCWARTSASSRPQTGGVAGLWGMRPRDTTTSGRPCRPFGEERRLAGCSET